MTITLRTALRPGDFAALAALTRGGLPELDERTLRRLVLADPALPRGAVLIAEEDGAPVGYAHVAVDDTGAHLISGAVEPERRRRGTGRTLLAAALGHARTEGASVLRISGYPPGYAAPGVDARDHGAIAFLRAQGAREAGRALAMARPLPSEGSAPCPPGVTISPCAPEELPAVLRIVGADLGADWAQLLHAHAAAGRALEQILLARDDAASADEPAAWLLGVAARGIVGEDPERFGPIGVLTPARGRGVGAALLDASLERMAAAGARRAWFQWTGPDSPAHRMYLRRGFTPLATTLPMTIPVPTSPDERTRA